eukprot:1142272-Rhodomonas_salina.4
MATFSVVALGTWYAMIVFNPTLEAFRASPVSPHASKRTPIMRFSAGGLDTSFTLPAGSENEKL